MRIFFYRYLAFITIGGQASLEIIQNAANATFVQAGSSGDLGPIQALASKPEQFMVSRRTQGEEPFPQLVRRGYLTGTRISGRRGLAAIRILWKRSFSIERRLVVTKIIDETVSSSLDEKGTQMGRVGEVPRPVSKAV